MNKAILILGLLILVGCSNNPEEKGFDELLAEDRELHYNYRFCKGNCKAKGLELDNVTNHTCYCKDREEPEINLTLGSIFDSNMSFGLDTFSYSSDYIFQSMNVNITFMNMTCIKVRCDCMDWGCMAMCLSCKGLNTNNTEKLKEGKNVI